MIKYLDAKVTLLEVPDEISICINITNCQYKCDKCHTPLLRCDVGFELTEKVIDELIERNTGITCICFMGEGNDKDSFINLLKYIKENYKNIKTCLYTGNDNIEDKHIREFSNYLDFLKIGRYVHSKGGLNSPKTNQKFYKIIDSKETILHVENLNHLFKNIKDETKS